MRIGIDLGGSKIEAIALADDGCEMLRERIASPRGNYEVTLRTLVDLVALVEQKTGEVGCVTNASGSLRCCIEDGSRSPEVGWQELVSNRPVRLRSKGVVVSDCGKGIVKMSGTY